MRVYMRDMRRAKYCSQGVRKFFERHDLNYSDFLKNGIESDQLVNTGDGMAIELVKRVEAWAADQRK